MVGYYSRGRGIESGRDRLFFGEKNLKIFSKKNIFPGVFKWFRLHKKVSLTTLGPSGTPGGATHGPSQAPCGLQNCQNGQKNGQNGQKMTQNHQKMTFFDFQSVYTQNDRNFALILNLSLIFEKNCQNRQKWPKMAKNGPKSPQSDFF